MTSHTGLQYVRFGAGDDSFYVPNFVPDHQEVFATISAESANLWVPREKMVFNIYNKAMQLPRDKFMAGVAEPDGTVPLYRYGGKYKMPVHPFSPTTENIRQLIASTHNQVCSHAVFNRYHLDNDHIGFHHDKVRDFTPGSIIYTVSFGAVRDFQLKYWPHKLDKASADADPAICKTLFTITLQPGSLIALGPRTNALYKHRIKSGEGCRISGTYRDIRTRYDPATDEIRGEEQNKKKRARQNEKDRKTKRTKADE